MDLVKKLRRNIRCWGQDAALRHAKKNGVGFVYAYYAVFGKIPRVHHLGL